MSRFDKYRGGLQLLPESETRKPSNDRLSIDLAKIEAVAAARAADPTAKLLGSPARVAIALDATRSMDALLQSAKSAIGEIVARASREAGQPVEIELIVFRDYDVPDQLVERSGAAIDPAMLVDWLRRIRPLGGGGNGGEAVEAALQCVVNGDFAVAILAGDEPSNSAAELAAAGRRETATALHHAQALGRRGVAIHSFVVGDDPRTIDDFASLSNASGGKSGRLDGSREMIDLAVMSILAALKGAAGVRRYIASTQLSDNSWKFGQQLLLSAK